MKISRRTFLKSTGLAAAALSFPEYGQMAAFAETSSLGSMAQPGLETPVLCGLCQARCPGLARCKDRQLISLRGNPASSRTGGRLCARGQAAGRLLHDPDRLKYPLKRVGSRGEGRWTRISWGEAIDTISLNIEKVLKQHGPEGLGLFCNGPSSKYLVELFRELGVTNIGNASREQCEINRETAYDLTFGSGVGRRYEPDFSGAKCIVLFGSHIGENVQVTEIRGISEALARGARLIVVDPRFSVMASKADHHLMIRPGTDTALLMGWINYCIENGFHNNQFVLESASGFAELRQAASAYPLEHVAKITDLPLELLKEGGDLLAASSPALVIHPGRYSSWYGNDVQRLRALAILTGLLGSSQWQDMVDKSLAQAAIHQDRAIQPECRLGSAIVRQTMEGTTKLLGCWGQNPFHAFPNPYRTMAAFQKAEFTFCCDILPSEPTLYADIVLPEATFLERSDVPETWAGQGYGAGPGTVGLGFAAMEPLFESKDPFWIVKQLSSRLGKGKGFGFDTVAERLDHDLREWGLSFAKLKNSQGIAPLDSLADFSRLGQTSKSKIAFYSTELRERGLPPLPLFESVSLPPEGYSRLLSGRCPAHSGTMTSNNPWLNHEVQENDLWLNDRVASQIGVVDGDHLFLENQDGIRSVKPVKIKVTPGIRVDCVFLAHGFGSGSPFLRQAFNRGVADGSLLTRSFPDPVTGVRGMRVNFVRFIRDGKELEIPRLDQPPEDLQQSDRWWFDAFGSFEPGSRRGKYAV